MTLSRAWDVLDRRALARLTFVDAIGNRVTTPVSIFADGVRLVAKRPGETIVLDAPGFEEYTAAFTAPPATPSPGTVTLPLDLRPIDAAYGARRFALSLPRDPDPAHSGDPSSLFRPVEISLLPAPGAIITGLVAALRVTVTRSDDGRAIEGALVRLRPEGGRPQARALTEASGDALLVVPGIPLSSPGAGAVVRSDIAADLDAVVDPALARFHTADEIDAARTAARRRTRNLIDPDDLEARLGAAATPLRVVRIAAGQTRTSAISWTP